MTPTSQITEQIQQAAAAAVKSLYDIDIAPEAFPVQETRKEFEGDFTLVVFPLAKYRLGAPPQIAAQLGEALLQRLEVLQSYNVIKGFLNLSFKSEFWWEFLAHQQQNEAFFRTSLGQGQKVVVEYCSPNTNKPLHLGHLRNIILGYSTTEILRANSFDTHAVCLYNDRGTAICKSMYAWLREGKNETPESTGKKGDVLVGDYYVAYSAMLEEDIAQLKAQGMDEEEAKKQAPAQKAVEDILLRWEQGDPEIRQLWQQMNEWVYKAHRQTFRRLGVAFDKFYYESELYQLGKQTVEKGLQMGAFYRKEDGSVWVDLTADGLDHKLLLRANGTSVYITQDLAAAEVRYDDYKMDRSVYVVGNEQDYHFKVLFLILKKLQKPFADGLYHLSYGMVDLPTGKMKSREGTRVDIDDLLDEMMDRAREETLKLGKTEGMDEAEREDLYQKIGLSAVKFFLAKVDPKKRMLFNPEESFDIHGHTGPFVQYAYTRTAALQRKAETLDLPPFTAESRPEQPLNEAERLLLRQLFQYPAVLQEAAAAYSPALIANYAYELAKAYNRFYQGEKILNPDMPHTSAFRFALSGFAGKTLQESMRLLGIGMPERM